jgi:predicted nuclease with TOPRIM domain
MNINNSGDGNEQNSASNQSEQPAQGPPAASKRDVQEAEKKADEARERADELEASLNELRAEYEDLQEQHEKALEVVDEQLEWFAENANFGWGKSPSREGSLKDAVKSRAASAISPSED